MSQKTDLIQSGERANRDLGRVFDQRIGTKQMPKGDIVKAFVKARRDLKENVGKPAMSSLLNTYRTEIRQAVETGAQEAVAIGKAQAEEQARILNLNVIFIGGLQPEIQQAVSDVMATVDGQIRAFQSGLLTEAQLLGYGDRLGLFMPGQVQRDAAARFANLTQLALYLALFRGASEVLFVKQAVAVLDKRTTPCCRAVNGQTVNLSEPFITVEVPAYAREQDRPPFHDWCRTSQVILPRDIANLP